MGFCLIIGISMELAYEISRRNCLEVAVNSQNCIYSVSKSSATWGERENATTIWEFCRASRGPKESWILFRALREEFEDTKGFIDYGPWVMQKKIRMSCLDVRLSQSRGCAKLYGVQVRKDDPWIVPFRVEGVKQTGIWWVTPDYILEAGGSSV